MQSQPIFECKEDLSVLKEKAHKLLMAGDLLAAHTLYKKAKDISPNDIEIRCDYGFICLKLARYIEAIDEFDFCISKEKDGVINFIARENKIFSCLMLRNYREAIQCGFTTSGQDLTQISTCSIEFKVYLAFAYLFIGQRGSLDQRFKEGSNEKGYTCHLATLGYALLKQFEIFDRTRQIKDITDIPLAISDLTADQIEEMYLLKGLGFVMLKDFVKAEKSFDDLLKQNSSSLPAYAQKSLLYLIQNEQIAAHAASRKGLEYDPENNNLKAGTQRTFEHIKKEFLQLLKITSDPGDEKKGSDQSRLAALRQQIQQGIAYVADKDGNTILHLAAELGAEESILNLLIEAIGANRKNALGQTPLYFAVKNGRINATRQLLRLTNKELIYGEEGIILEVAMRYEQSPALIDLLLTDAVDLNKPLPGGKLPPLHLAATTGHADIITHLVQRGAKVNLHETKEPTPLSFAALATQDRAVAALIKAGAEFDDSTPKGAELLAAINQQTSTEPFSPLTQRKKLSVLEQLRDCSQAQRNDHGHVQSSIKMLNEIICLAIFNQISIQASTSDKSMAVLQQMVARFLELAEIQPLAHRTIAKLNPQKSTTAEVSNFLSSQQFRKFIRYHTIEKLPELASIHRWVELAGNDTTGAKEHNFKVSLHQSLQEFIELKNVSDVIVDNIANQAISNLVAEEKLAKKIEKLKLDKEKLHKWFCDTFNKKSLATQLGLDQKILENTLSTHGTNLSDTVSTQYRYSLKDKATFDLKTGNREIIFRQRASAASDLWLAEHTKPLNHHELIAYQIATELAQNLSSTLQLKKIDLVRNLLKTTLLTNSPLLSFLAQNKNEIPALIEWLSTKLKSLKTSHLSVDAVAQDKYAIAFKVIAHEWFDPYKKQMQREQEKKVTANEKRETFISEFLNQFDLMYGMYNALDRDLVRRAETTIDEVAGIMEKCKDKLPTFQVYGLQVDIGQLANMFVSIGISLEDKRVAKSARRMTDLFYGYNALERNYVVHDAASYIADRFRNQLSQLSVRNESIKDLARCAADRAVEYIVRSDENVIKNSCGIFNRLLNKIKTAILGGPSAKSDLKAAHSVIVDGVLQGKSRDHDTKKIHQDNIPWLANMVFENTIIVACDATGKLSRFCPKNTNQKDYLDDSYSDETAAQLEARGYVNIGPAPFPKSWDELGSATSPLPSSETKGDAKAERKI